MLRPTGLRDWRRRRSPLVVRMLRPTGLRDWRRRRSPLLLQRAIRLLRVLGHLAGLELGGGVALERALDAAIHHPLGEFLAVVIEPLDGVLDGVVIACAHGRAP